MMSKLIQVALCTSNMPQTIRTFLEVFGFDSAGGRPRWGANASTLQELPTGADTAIMLWWLIGRQDFGGQIELFHHTVPVQRPRSPEWRPSDLGWTRFGMVVPDFDGTLGRLQAAGLSTLTEPVEVNGFRRVCFREPSADVIVEVMEEDEAFPGGLAGSFDPRPALAYVAVSVADLATSRQHFVDLFGFTELAPDTIHSAEHERMWGLDRARRDCAVLDGGDVLLELVQYEDPAPKPPAADALLSDQGIMNVAVGYRDQTEIAAAIAAASTLGVFPTLDVPTSSGSTYIRLDDRLSVELLLVPEDLDAHFGYVPQDIAPPGNIHAPKRPTVAPRG